MSTLQHVCEDCGHVERAHQQELFTRCRCCANEAPPKNLSPEPVITPTFDARTFEPEPLLRPGERYNPGNMSGRQTCACQACQDAYAEATAT